MRAYRHSGQDQERDDGETQPVRERGGERDQTERQAHFQNQVIHWLLNPSMNQQVFQSFDCPTVAREDERRPFVEHSLRARIESLHSVRLNDGDNGSAGPLANLKVLDRLSNALRPGFNRVPLEQEVLEYDFGGRQSLGHISQPPDDAGHLPGLAVGKSHDRGDLVRGFARKMVELARAVVVNYNGQPVAARRLDLELAPDAGKIRFADGRHNPLFRLTKRLNPLSL